MVEQVPSNLARVQLTLSHPAIGEISVHTFHFIQPAPFDQPAAKSLAQLCIAFVNTAMASAQSWVLSRTAVYWSGGTTPSGGDWGQQWVFPELTASGNPSSNTALPPQLAVVLSLVTSTAGRSGRGRMYLGPWSQDALNGGQGNPLVSAGLQTQLNSAATTLRNAAASAGATWCVFSRTKQDMHAIVQTKVGNRFDTQRRRRSAFREAYAVSA